MWVLTMDDYGTKGLDVQAPKEKLSSRSRAVSHMWLSKETARQQIAQIGAGTAH